MRSSSLEIESDSPISLRQAWGRRSRNMEDENALCENPLESRSSYHTANTEITRRLDNLIRSNKEELSSLTQNDGLLFSSQQSGIHEKFDADGADAETLLGNVAHSTADTASIGHSPEDFTCSYPADHSPRHDRDSALSTAACISSLPGSEADEPSAYSLKRAQKDMYFQEVQSCPTPATAASSQHSTGHQRGTSSQDGGVVSMRRPRSNNFWRGDIKSASHQLHKASVIAIQQRASRRSRESFLSSSTTGSDTGIPRISIPGGTFLAPPDTHRSSSFGDGSTPRSRQSSVLGRIRAGLNPANLKAIVSRQSTGDLLSSQYNGHNSVPSFTTDISHVLNMSDQVLEAVSKGVRHVYHRQRLESQLGDNVNKRMAWMNRVLGSLYVDDNMVQDEDEDNRKNEVMFHPNSPFRARWDVIIILVIVYQVAVMPVRVVWGNNTIGALFALEMGLSLLLALDVVLSFYTGWENDGDVVMDKQRVRRRYLTTWFVPELISSLPYDTLALLSQGRDPRSYTSISLRAVRMLSLLRWPRLWKYIQKWQDLVALDSVLIKLGKYWLGLLMFIHTAGCLVALQAFLQRDNPDSFFNRTDFSPSIHEEPALMNRGPFTQYTYSVFRSSSGYLSSGYGASNPETLEELWMVLMVMFTGSVMQLVFQAAILTLVRTYDRSTSNYMQHMEMVKAYFSRHHIPQDIKSRVVTQLMARHTNRRLMTADTLLRDMSPSMRIDLQVQLAASVLKQQPIFSTWRSVVVRAVAAELVHCTFATGDTIFFKGEMADCMYFVADGVVRIVDSDSGKLLTTITKGSYFGEFALLQGERGVRSASAEAAITTHLFSLSRKTFYRIAAHYPEMVDSLSIIAAARSALNSNQTVNAEELLRIKNMRSSYLMNICRANVALTIIEEDEEGMEAQAEADQPART